MPRYFPALALLYLVLVGALIFRVPPGHAPDEVAHVDYVKYIVENSGLPTFRGAAPPNYGYEFHQPPLYYAVCAPGGLLFSGDALFLWCRAISALFGLGTLFLIAHAARVLWPENEQLELLATGAAAVWPLHLGVSATAGNDSIAGFFCAALFCLIARGSVQGWAARDAIWAGLCCGLGLWTKTTTLPVALVTLGAAWQLQSQGYAARWRGLPAPLAMTIIGAVIALPLFVRNQNLYGDPLGWSAFSQAATAGTPGYPVFSQAGIDFIHLCARHFINSVLHLLGLFWRAGQCFARVKTAHSATVSARFNFARFDLRFGDDYHCFWPCALAARGFAAGF